MATHSRILTWRIPWTEEPDGLQSTGLQRDATEDTYTHTDPETNPLLFWVCSLILFSECAT